MAKRRRLHGAHNTRLAGRTSFYITPFTDVELTTSETLNLDAERREGGRDWGVTDSSLHVQRESWTWPDDREPVSASWHTHDTYLNCAASTVPSMGKKRKKKNQNHVSKGALRQHGVFVLPEVTNFAVGNDTHSWLKSGKSREAFVERSLLLLAFLANAGVALPQQLT